MFKNKGASSMVTVIADKKVKKTKTKFNDEFDNYLKSQCTKTTFNGSEIESFSWYKKVLGLV